MQYKEYKEIPKLSRLGMGLMRLPVQDEDFGRIDYDKAMEEMKNALSTMK